MTLPTTPTQSPPPERTRFRLTGRSVSLDPRVHAARGDLADMALAGVLFSAHYARAVPMTCVARGSRVLTSPAHDAMAASELLRGEIFHVLDVTTNWTWGFCGHDGYVGYVRREALDHVETPTWRVVARGAPVFSAPDIKSWITVHWPMGALFDGELQGDFIACAEGFIHVRHVRPITERQSDWASVAQLYIGQPYVWGGRGHHGVDCSGLVQVALDACGIATPRDSDMQRESIGNPIAEDAPLRRGDFIFFPGHVGIMADETHLLHANAHWMTTMIEPLADVIGRAAPEHERPVIARRRITP